MPVSIDDLTEDHPKGELNLEDAQRELRRLRDIQPHAVITTNYDQFLENIFNDSDDSEEDSLYDVVVGEKVLDTQYKSIGEILKIHGSSTNPESLILTSEDYIEFNKRKRYLSSKMVTYFSEHPLLIVGYSATDDNVQKILSWVNDVITEEGDVADDIYFVEFERDIESRSVFQTEKRIPLLDGNSIVVKRIVAKDFDWVFDAFASGEGFEADVRYLRKLVANMYEVVRNREPRAKVVDHRQLEDIATDEDELATVLGISAVGDSPGVEFNHKYSPEDALLIDRLRRGGVAECNLQRLYPSIRRDG